MTTFRMVPEDEEENNKEKGVVKRHPIIWECNGKPQAIITGISGPSPKGGSPGKCGMFDLSFHPNPGALGC